MPAAKLSEECWKEIRLANEAGVDDEALSMDYGVSKNAIKQRRFREKWLTPAKIAAAAEEAKALKSMRAKRSAGVTAVTNQPKAEVTIAAQLTELAERNGLRVSQMVDRAMREVMDDPPPMKFWSDISTGIKLQRQVAGMDKDSSPIQINLGAIFNPSKESGVVVLDAEEG